MAICLFFFAFSTVLGWNLFGKINVIYLFGKKSPKLCTTIYTVVALIFIFLGTTMSNDLVWELTDMFNNLMVIPNAIALFALTSVVVRVARHHQGTFILRIEDTDQTRQVEGATEVIYRTLAECGLDHDEGPDVGGPD